MLEWFLRRWHLGHHVAHDLSLLSFPPVRDLIISWKIFVCCAHKPTVAAVSAVQLREMTDAAFKLLQLSSSCELEVRPACCYLPPLSFICCSCRQLQKAMQTYCTPHLLRVISSPSRPAPVSPALFDLSVHIRISCSRKTTDFSSVPIDARVH